MADFSKAKTNKVSAYPVHAKEWTGDVQTYEPLLDVKTLKRRFLKNVDIKEWSSDDLKDMIKAAINMAEIELNVPIVPRVFEDRLPFDRNLYRKFVHTQTRQKPIRALLDFSIVSANEENLFTIPSQWCDLGQAHVGQINIIPYLAAYSTTGITSTVSNAGIAFLATLESIQFVPSYWTVKYVAGLGCDDGTVPVLANELIGVIAAIDILSNKGPENKYSSVSLSQDGIGQSTGGPGHMLYTQRIQELTLKRDKLINKLKGKFGRKYQMTNI